MPWFPLRSLRGKLQLFSSLLIVVPGVLVALIAYASARDGLERTAARQLTEVAHDTLDEVTEAVAEAQRDLRAWARQEVMADVMVEDVSQQITRVLRSLIETNPQFSGLAYVDMRGGVVAASDPHWLIAARGDGAGARTARAGSEFRGPPATVVADGSRRHRPWPRARPAYGAGEQGHGDRDQRGRSGYDLPGGATGGEGLRLVSQAGTTPACTTGGVPVALKLVPAKIKRSVVHLTMIASGGKKDVDRLTLDCEPGQAPSFTASVQPILRERCATVGCHTGQARSGGMDLSASVAYTALVGPVSTYKGIPQVQPGSLKKSYLAHKITGQGGYFGAVMPSGAALTAEEKFTVLTWIQAGAPNN